MPTLFTNHQLENARKYYKSELGEWTECKNVWMKCLSWSSYQTYYYILFSNGWTQIKISTISIYDNDKWKIYLHK